MGGTHPSILIATPVHTCKSYSFQPWLDAVRQFPCDVLAVDNSPTLDFFNRWRHQVDMLHLDLGNEPPNRRIALSMDCIREYVLANGYDWWWDIEADVVVSNLMWDFVLPRLTGDWLTIPYPKDGQLLERSFGCTFFSRGFLQRVNFEQPRELSGQTTDGWFAGLYGAPRVLYSALIPQHLQESPCSSFA